MTSELIRVVRRLKPRIIQYLPDPCTAKITFESGVPANTDAYIDVEPPDGYNFAITKLVLTTPLDCTANVLLVGLDGTEVLLLSDWLDEDKRVVYSMGGIDYEPLVLRKFRLLARTKVDIAEARSVLLNYSGGLIKE